MRFFKTAPEAMPGHVGADGMKKTLSFSEGLFQVEVQAKYHQEQLLWTC